MDLTVDLGLGGELVGTASDVTSHPGISDVPVVARRLDDGDTAVRGEAPLLDGVAPHEHVARIVIDRAALAEARPDVIFTEEVCPVCLGAYAPLAEGAAVAAGAAGGRRVRVVSLAPRRLDDVLAQIVPVATLLGHPERGQTLLKVRGARLLALGMHVARYLVRSDGARPRVAFLERAEPLRALGRWVPDMIDAAGGIPSLVRPGDDTATVAPSAVLDARPEVLLLGTGGGEPG
ncbi:MAG: hypothetical protein ACRDI2_26515, partial [Chloroflexota bacterium]